MNDSHDCILFTFSTANEKRKDGRQRINHILDININTTHTKKCNIKKGINIQDDINFQSLTRNINHFV